MSYIENTNQTNKTGPVVAVVAIHAALGYVLVSGLAATAIEEVFSGPLPTTEYKDPPPPPPPTPEPDTQPDAATAPKVYTPPVPTPLPPKPNFIDTTSELPDISDTIRIPLPPAPTPKPPVMPSPKPPAFDPVSASPKNSPGGWVTTNDYRSNWIRQEMTGTASFRLEIAANGKVTNCTITRSTGHGALDDATCSLISKRARFEPARDGNGEKTAGSYTSSIRWVLPD